METYESVKSNPVQPEQKEKKKGGAWKGIVAVILAAGVVGSTTISAFNLVTLKSYIAEQKKEENPETTEDYVKIADNYEIKPTTNISDAYKSGDTSKLTDKEKETLDMAKKAIKDMKITDSMSDFEKEKVSVGVLSSLAVKPAIAATKRSGSAHHGAQLGKPFL